MIYFVLFGTRCVIEERGDNVIAGELIGTFRI